MTEAIDKMTVSDLATAHPVSTRVLYRHRIEFCVGAARSLLDACHEAGLEVGTLLAEVESEESTAGATAIAWINRPLGELVDYIELDFHVLERREMEQLAQQFAHRSSSGADVTGHTKLAALFDTLRQELTEHMAKEEAVLFPWIRSGRGDLARMPIQVMMMEHDTTLALLNRLRDETQVVAASQAAPAAQEICTRLSDLDRHIREHMHLENNLLFPRALRGES